MQCHCPDARRKRLLVIRTFHAVMAIWMARLPWPLTLTSIMHADGSSYFSVVLWVLALSEPVALAARSTSKLMSRSSLP
jgi:hypothetical protein